MKKNNRQSGQIIIFALVFMLIMTVAAAALLNYTTLNIKGTKQDYNQNKALYMAEAGLDKAIEALNADSSYSGENNTALEDGAFSVSVATIDGSTKRVTSTGYFPDSNNPRAIKTVKATVGIDITGVAFNFGLQVGIGGLVMDNNSQVVGNVFSNGNITGDNGIITGDATIAAGTSAFSDQNWEVQNNDFTFGNVSSRRDVAQSFVPSVSERLNRVQVYIKKFGNPGDLTVRILANNVTNPSKTVLASASLAASQVTGSYGWVEATFPTPANLVSGVTYWLMLSVPSINGSNYYAWGSDSNNGYGNGVGKSSSNWNGSSPVWNSISGDMNYRIFMGGVATYLDGNISVGGNVQATEIRSCGTVTDTATYDTVFTNCTAGTSVAGVEAPGPEPMPISQARIDEWKAVAQAGGVISGSRTVNGFETLGPVMIDGDLVLNNNAIVNLTGPVWVKGNITTYQNATIRVDATMGNNGTVLLADNLDNPTGSSIVTISNNTAVVGNGNPNSFPMVVTTSNNPTGAMYVNNNSTAAIYYAPYGSIEVSNNAGGNQITGNRVHLSNNAVVTYNIGLQNATFANGPGGAWVFMPGSYVIEQ